MSSINQTQDVNTEEVVQEVAKADATEEIRDASSDDDFTATEASKKPAVPKKKRKSRRSRTTDSDGLDATGRVYAAELLPAPYYYYRNHTLEVDEDPLKPVTSAGHVPCFPAKMRTPFWPAPELHDIVAWDDHGRSFRILKPKNFWNRISSLPSLNIPSSARSFVKPMGGASVVSWLGLIAAPTIRSTSLRSMPWLCKKMRRPKVGEKKSISLDHEPDLRMISQAFPVPNLPMTREIQVVLRPSTAAAVSINNGSVAAIASANPYGIGAMTLPMAQSTAAASANPQMLSYLQALNEQTRPDAGGFAAGFRAGTLLHNRSMNSMLINQPLPHAAVSGAFTGLPTGVLGAAQPESSQANVEYMRLLQMAAQVNMGVMGAASAAPFNVQGNLTMEQLEAYQTGMGHPSLPR
ncbi:hypothetical protein ACHAWO_008375 [Cyclotella atomus]|uniref:HSF-type DNA-binding domain-containing protein n=1 Tax=Cyclotella atomus TaxID=382360 RepID=A0ABD3P7H8_9STRA